MGVKKTSSYRKNWWIDNRNNNNTRLWPLSIIDSIITMMIIMMMMMTTKKQWQWHFRCPYIGGGDRTRITNEYHHHQMLNDQNIDEKKSMMMIKTHKWASEYIGVSYCCWNRINIYSDSCYSATPLYITEIYSVYIFNSENKIFGEREKYQRIAIALNQIFFHHKYLIQKK